MSTMASRAVQGAAAGVAGTVAMTLVMQGLHRRLPSEERYPLPPREITERVGRSLAPTDRAGLPDASLNAHLAYGAAVGALLGLGARRPGLGIGAAYGVFVWAASYFGWVPALGVLAPATAHPARRNMLMIAAHLVWGGATAASLRVFAGAKAGMLAAGPLADAGEGEMPGGAGPNGRAHRPRVYRDRVGVIDRTAY
ncbi:MAG: hypothetical protein JWP50_289 [Phenylobacterium sp.]|nr:hypothetical protein [Phenylobacterium sp.]